MGRPTKHHVLRWAATPLLLGLLGGCESTAGDARDAATDAPVATDAPIAVDAPVASDVPATTDVPAAIDTPIVTDVPAATDTPTAIDVPAAIDTPASTDVPAAIDTPVVTDVGPSDAGDTFCATARCAAGTRCCEAARTCIPMGAFCILAPPDAGPSGCGTAADCARGEECVYPDTACAPRGTCMSAIACLIAAPFCGCDGVTFRGCRPDRPTTARGECPPTADAGTLFCPMVRCAAGYECCEAARACIPNGTTCGGSTGTCTTNAQCGARQWCAGTGCDTPGTCTPLGDVCTSIYAPVCGCDGRTYSNECVANVSGVRAASRGACAL